MSNSVKYGVNLYQAAWTVNMVVYMAAYVSA